MRAAALAVVVATACGRIDFDLISDTTGCWPSWRDHSIRFDPPHEITELGFDQDQTNETLSADAQTMYFDRAGANVELYVTHRTGRDQPWMPPVNVASLSTSRDEGQLAPSPDATFAVYASDVTGTDQLYYTLGPDAGGMFGPPTQDLLAQVDALPSVFDPALAAGGRHLYFTSMHADGSEAIALATRAATTAAFGTPVSLDELQLSSAEADSTFSPGELVIVFTDGDTTAANDLYYATRASPSDRFGTPLLVPDVNLPNIDDRDGWLAYDGCELFFVTNRQGRLKLYVAAAL